MFCINLLHKFGRALWDWSTNRNGHITAKHPNEHFTNSQVETLNHFRSWHHELRWLFRNETLIKGQKRKDRRRVRNRKFSHKNTWQNEEVEMILWECSAHLNSHHKFLFVQWKWKKLGLRMDDSTENLSTRRIIDNFYCYFIPMISSMRTWAHDTDWSICLNCASLKRLKTFCWHKIDIECN